MRSYLLGKSLCACVADVVARHANHHRRAVGICKVARVDWRQPTVRVIADPVRPVAHTREQLEVRYTGEYMQGGRWHIAVMECMIRRHAGVHASTLAPPTKNPTDGKTGGWSFLLPMHVCCHWTFMPPICGVSSGSETRLSARVKSRLPSLTRASATAYENLKTGYWVMT